MRGVTDIAADSIVVDGVLLVSNAVTECLQVNALRE